MKTLVWGIIIGLIGLILTIVGGVLKNDLFFIAQAYANNSIALAILIVGIIALLGGLALVGVGVYQKLNKK